MRYCFVIALFLWVSQTSANHGPITWSATWESIVVVQPTWHLQSRRGHGAPAGINPEGSGVVWSHNLVKNITLILTAAHVIRDSVAVQIQSADGYSYEAKIEWKDSSTDLAMLSITGILPPVKRSAEKPIPGQHVCALGNPFGLGVSVSCGVISGFNRSDIGFNEIEDFLQTDAAINPGSSGGALVDAEGNLVGLIAAIFTKEADIDAGVNFAVSLPLINRTIQRLGFME